MSMFLLVVVIPQAAFAETAIHNNISVSTKTGGNSAPNGGEIVTGSQRASVHIETRVNDEAVTGIQKTSDQDTVIHTATVISTSPTVSITTQKTHQTAVLPLEYEVSKKDTHLILISHLITSYSKTMAYVLSHHM